MLKDKYEFSSERVTKKPHAKFNKYSLAGVIPWFVLSSIFITIQVITQQPDAFWIIPVVILTAIFIFIGLMQIDEKENVFLLWLNPNSRQYLVRGLDPKNASHPIYKQAMDDMLKDIKNDTFDQNFWSNTFIKLNLEMPKTPLTQRDRVNYVEMMKDMNKLMELP